MESLIEGCNVTDAKEVYEILGQEKIEISIQLKQDYLEMLCFHNSNDEEMEEDFNESKGLITANQNKLEQMLYMDIKLLREPNK